MRAILLRLTIGYYVLCALSKVTDHPRWADELLIAEWRRRRSGRKNGLFLHLFHVHRCRKYVTAWHFTVIVKLHVPTGTVSVDTYLSKWTSIQSAVQLGVRLSKVTLPPPWFHVSPCIVQYYISKYPWVEIVPKSATASWIEEVPTSLYHPSIGLSEPRLYFLHSQAVWQREHSSVCLTHEQGRQTFGGKWFILYMYVAFVWVYFSMVKNGLVVFSSFSIVFGFCVIKYSVGFMCNSG